MTPNDDPIDRADALLDQGRAAEAAALTAGPAAKADAPHAALATHASALKALGRPLEALAFNERAADRYPQSPVAWHNLAATLGDLGRGQESRAAAERAMKLGLDAPQTWSVYARALLAVGELDAAERAYAECRKRAPAAADIAVEHANVVWMRTGDLGASQALLDQAFHAGGPAGALVMAKARLMEAAGQPEAAAQLLAMAALRMPDDVSVVLAASQAAVELGQVDAAARLVAQAMAKAPNDPLVLNQQAIVAMARSAPGEALAAAVRGLDLDPDNQSLIGWAATAARAIGDPLYGDLYDYAKMVGVYDIEAPQGWPSLDAYLKDLATSLRRMHPFVRHPFHQSLRQGSQTLQPLAGSDEPAIAAFFKAIDAPIRQHMAALGRGLEPLRRRNTGKYRILSAWSVLLKPGGFHKDHFHPEGWLSSAFYVETPDQALAGDGRDGWIRFGRPPTPTNPPLEAGHYVKPKPGRLVLFPSYMWHGTEPFWTDESRMTMAFDVRPD